MKLVIDTMNRKVHRYHYNFVRLQFDGIDDQRLGIFNSTDRHSDFDILN